MISYILLNQSKILLLLVLSVIRISYAERVSDKIYIKLQSDHYCSRRLNATHQFGCQSNLGGNYGVVWFVSETYDLLHILKLGPTPPYIPILDRKYYTRENLLEFKANPDRVSGVVFLDREQNSEAYNSPFSPDDLCPNRYSGLYVNDSMYGSCKYPWQDKSPVTGLLYEDIPFPIFLINEKESIDNLETCFNANNVIIKENKNKDKPKEKTQASYPLCGIQLDSFTLAAKDSEFCLNSHFIIDEILQSNQRRCYPVDNNNVFGYYKTAKGPLHANDHTPALSPDVAKPQSIVMLVAKLSSLSMFSEISPGADSTITSIITLLATAEALANDEIRKSVTVQNSSRNIAFALLDSEPFDFTGSSRMVYNMMENSFPFHSYNTNDTEAMQNTNLTSIDYLINLDQMANYRELNEPIYLHSDPNDQDNTKLDSFYEIAKQIGASKDLNIRLERVYNMPLPPTSAHEFIESSRKLDGSKLLGVVLSNYERKYKNQLYNSVYDNSHNIFRASKNNLVQHLTRVSSLVARVLYQITFQTTDSSKIKANEQLIEHLLDCYLIDAQCALFTRACRAGQRLPKGPIQTYKDPTKRSDDINGIITADLLAYFIGEKIAEYNFTRCYEENYNSTVYNYQYINDKSEPIEDGSSGTCVRSQVIMRSSGSPAFSLRNEEIVIDTKYPAWTVSLNSIRNPVRLYLIPSPSAQWSIFVLGILITTTSFAIVLAVDTRLKHLSRLRDRQEATST